MASVWAQMKNKYSVAKTLRFELQPMGATAENMKRKSFTEHDAVLATDYKKIKTLIDEWHKNYIEERLHNLKFSKQELDAALNDDTKGTNKKNLYKKVIHEFDKVNNELLFKKNNLVEFLKTKNLYTPEAEKVVKEFNGFQTYLVGFNQNRQNIYSTKGTAGSIAYRILNDNLPRFDVNIKRFSDIAEVSNLSIPSDLFALEHFNKCLCQSGIETYNKTIGGYNSKINEYNQKNKTKISLFRELYKQILSDRADNKIYEPFKSKNDVVDAVKEFAERCNEVFDVKKESIITMVAGLSLENYHGIYIAKDKLNMFSCCAFGSWNFLESCLDKETQKHKQVDVQILLKRLEPENQAKFITTIQSIKELVTKAQKECKEIKYENIKVVLDAIKRVQEALCIFHAPEQTDCNAEFYKLFERDYEILADVIPLYNKARNFMTQKPYSNEKIKINFDNSTLLAGWDENKEGDNFGVILRTKDYYFLGILDEAHKKLFQTIPSPSANEECFEKMVYKLIPDVAKMLPKIAFPTAKPNCLENMPDNEYEKIKAIYTYNKQQKESNSKFQLGGSDLKNLIEFYKIFLQLYYPHIRDWNFKSKYETYREFIMDVDKVGYNVKFNPVPKTFIDDAVRDGKLYLYKIYSKDFSPDSHGMPNLHTLYFKSLFCDANLESRTHKLSGGAEIFWRKASLERKITHRAGEPLKCKRDPNIVIRPKHDLIKDKRFTEDKRFFHVPIELNRASEDVRNLNPEINDIIRHNKVNVIGIDRGERHLLYLVLIDHSGKIILQHSLNELSCLSNGREYKTDYNDLLSKREGEQRQAQLDWTEIGKIKDLKHGYMSNVVPQIIDMAIKHNAIIALENLNVGFKSSRTKVKKSIYQNFEKALIDKLCYTVKKDRDPSSVIGGLQLANEFVSFKKMSTENGILFYVDPSYTSVIDPTTGYTPTTKLNFINIPDARVIINKFKSFTFNTAANYFEINVDNWKICTHGTRIINQENGGHWKSVEIDVTQKLKDLFVKNGINFNFGDLRNELVKPNNATFYKDLFQLLKIAFGLRNSYIGETEDFILSPVKNKRGEFFDSRVQAKLGNNAALPVCADANGAYHIALKGLMALEQIERTGEWKLEKGKEQEKWFKFARARCN